MERCGDLRYERNREFTLILSVNSRAYTESEFTLIRCVNSRLYET